MRAEMNYSDDMILSTENYEHMAKAYANAMKQKGYMIVQVDNEKNRELILQTFDLLSKIKSCLFRLGGFLNTSKMYSLNERQIKKLTVIFESELPSSTFSTGDKTKTFLMFLSFEALLIKNLIELKEQSNFETDITRIVNDRLILLSQITNPSIS